MHKNLLASTAFTLLLCLTPLSSYADESPHFLGFSIGYYDAFDDYEDADFRLEYRSGSNMFIDNMHPWAGLELTNQGSLWTGGGLLYDWNFTDQWHLIPSAGLGLYFQGGADRDLDYPIEFRTQLELDYELDSGSRIGLGLSHTSNASIGDDNPGTEVLSVYYHIPIDGFLK